MKKLEVYQMECIYGGRQNTAADTVKAVDVGCCVVALAGVAASIATVGGAAGVALAIGSAWCAGWAIGSLFG